MTCRELARKVLLLSAASLAVVATSVSAQIFNDIQSELRVMWIQMKRDTPRHPNPRVQQFTQCIAWAIIDVLPEEFQNLDWEVIVFDLPEKNAMVMPDGKIAVFSGILEVANTADKLAAVLGHEVAHLTQGHVKERSIRMAGTGLLGLGGAILGGGLVSGGEAQQGAQVIFQYPFQREQEREADFVGMEYMAKAGYNPAAVLELWRDMANATQSRMPEFLSTHPEPDLRRTGMAGNLSPSLVIYNQALDSGVRPRCRF